MTARSVEEIRADLATEEGRGGLRRLSPIGRLVADVPELLESRERAIRWAVTLESQLARLEEFARWLVSMDDPEDVIGAGERQTVNLTKIIDRARAALTGSTE